MDIQKYYRSKLERDGEIEKRILSYSIYDVPRIEQWLEEMSRKGLHWDRFKGMYAWFWPGHPANCRYRLEACGKENQRLDEDTIALYEAAGWEYLGCRRKEFHVWRSVRPDAREPHGDPVMVLYAMDLATLFRLKRSLWAGVPMVRQGGFPYMWIGYGCFLGLHIISELLLIPAMQ